MTETTDTELPIEVMTEAELDEIEAKLTRPGYLGPWKATLRLNKALRACRQERGRLKSANEHWHIRVTALKADVDVSLAERDRLKAINAELLSICQVGIDHAQRVCDAWMTTDLADAINALEAWQQSAEKAITKAQPDAAPK